MILLYLSSSVKVNMFNALSFNINKLIICMEEACVYSGSLKMAPKDISYKSLESINITLFGKMIFVTCD